MLIIIKPSNKKSHKKILDWLLAACLKREIKYQLLLTCGDFDSDRKKITQAAVAFSKVVVIGGDGTLHLAVNALLESGCTLALLPCGTGNDFARGFNCKAEDWQHAVFSTQPSYVDIGQINLRYFINIAGVGFDAHVVNKLRGKHALTSFMYSLAGFKHLLNYRSKKLQGEFAGQSREYTNLITVFANHHYFGGGLAIAPKASLNNGQLECYRMIDCGILGNLYSFIRLVFRNHHTMKKLEYQRLNTATINTPGLLIEADGELIGLTPAKVTVHPNALRFCVPAKHQNKT